METSDALRQGAALGQGRWLTHLRVILALVLTHGISVRGWQPTSLTVRSRQSGPDRVRHATRLWSKASTSQLGTHHQPVSSTLLNQTNLLDDGEFEKWVRREIQQFAPAHLWESYRYILEKKAPEAITKWRQRYRGNKELWRRLFKRERCFKELIEALPLMDAVLTYLRETPAAKNITIVDLASGKGYLSMFLSEWLPPDQVDRLVLMDKAWPMQGHELKAHHISWEHIYGFVPPSDSQTYQETWPIPLVTSKQDLKQPSNHRTLQRRFFSKAQGPVIMLAIHLCGTLSLRAVDLFNDNPQVTFMALKPCCLPPMVHVKQDEVFSIGQHQFEAKSVCSAGKWVRKQWYGPPRWHLELRFQTWAENLFLGMGSAEDGDDIEKARVHVKVQTEGGYQNAFIFAQRSPITGPLWNGLQPHKVETFLLEQD